MKGPNKNSSETTAQTRPDRIHKQSSSVTARWWWWWWGGGGERRIGRDVEESGNGLIWPAVPALAGMTEGNHEIPQPEYLVSGPFKIRSSRALHFAGFEVLTAVVMKSYIFWDVMASSSPIVNRRFRGTQQEISMIQLASRAMWKSKVTLWPSWCRAPQTKS
jgi:hypothetical protein